METLDTQLDTQKASAAPATGSVLIRLRLIGQMEAWTASRENILPTGRKTRGLLAIVALSAPRPVLRGKLAEMLWSRRPEEQARASLRQEIHRLNDALAPWGPQVLQVNRDHLALKPGTVWVDVDELSRGNALKPATLSLLDGELLEGLDGIDSVFDNWLAAERERLNDRARSLADSMLRDQTEPSGMIAAAQQLLRIDRTHEGAWRAMMRAHLATGERGMALQAFERCRAVLADQLDARPSPETQRLAAEIRNEAPATRAGAEATAGLPPPLLSMGAAPAAARPAPRPTIRPPGRVLPDAPIGARRVTTEPTWSETPPELPAEEQAVRSAMPLGGPRIGVLPLQLMGMPESDLHMAVGIADAVTADLGRFRWMSIASSSGLARFAAQSRDENTLRQALGLDYLLDGIAQRESARVRVSFRLLDLRGGNQVICTERFEATAETLLTLQDEIAALVSAKIEPIIMTAETQRVAARPARTPSAYDRLLRGIALLGRPDQRQLTEAGDLLRQAVALAPDSCAVHAWYAWWHILMGVQGWSKENGSAAVGLAERAMTLDQRDARPVTLVAHARAFQQRRLQEAMTLHEHALGLNPNLAMSWALAGLASAWLGRLDEASYRLNRYKQLSPHDPQSFALDSGRVLINLLRHEHERAIEIGRGVTTLNGGFRLGQTYYVSALGHANGGTETEAVRSRLLSNHPEITVSRFLSDTTLQRDEDRLHVAEGLRLAGVPD